MKRVKEINDLLDGKTGGIVAVLLSYSFSICLNKVRIIKYILKNPDNTMNRISTELEIDYRNVWRIIKELRDIEVLVDEEISQGKGTKIRFKNETTRKVSKD